MEHSRGDRKPPVAEGDKLRLTRLSYLAEEGDPPNDLSLLLPAPPPVPVSPLLMPLLSVMVTGEVVVVVVARVVVVVVVVIVVVGGVRTPGSPSGGDTVVVGACWPTGTVSCPRMAHACVYDYNLRRRYTLLVWIMHKVTQTR